MVAGLLDPPSWRALRPEEFRVELGPLEERIEREVTTFYDTLLGVLGKVQDTTIQKSLRVTTREWNQLRTLALSPDAEMAPYRTFLKSYLNDLYQFSRVRAAREIEQRVPITTRGFQIWLESKTQTITELHAALLESRARLAILGRLPGESAEDAIIRVFDNFSKSELRKAGEFLALQAIQAGRIDVGDLYGNEVATWTWSAVLDRRVCPICQELDGTTWRQGDHGIIYPPLHFWCRCLLIGTPTSATRKPEVTGLPEGFVLPSEVQTFLKLGGRYPGRRAA